MKKYFKIIWKTLHSQTFLKGWIQKKNERKICKTGYHSPWRERFPQRIRRRSLWLYDNRLSWMSLWVSQVWVWKVWFNMQNKPTMDLRCGLLWYKMINDTHFIGNIFLVLLNYLFCVQIVLFVIDEMFFDCWLLKMKFMIEYRIQCW